MADLLHAPRETERRKQWLMHPTFVTNEKELRKVLCTCVQRRTMVNVQRMENRFPQVQKYTADSVSLEIQRDLGSSCY